MVGPCTKGSRLRGEPDLGDQVRDGLINASWPCSADRFPGFQQEVFDEIENALDPYDRCSYRSRLLGSGSLTGGSRLPKSIQEGPGMRP